ncbi:hypothetical protein CWATWH0005_2064 [Crocosphaera watsonii WH 0005]|uniref:Uncharacterized protein n=1 Tax=Crocosphaera watsonii WH 0005 TaxID=423472 RepID=T2IQV8_CROWT|nr:hypothetical protein CWATWH0005_2064 [Crocosphaera watsonii WH 0005]
MNGGFSGNGGQKNWAIVNQFVMWHSSKITWSNLNLSSFKSEFDQ